MTIIAKHRYLLLYGLIGFLVSLCYNGFSQCGLSGNFVFTDTNNGNADTFYKQIVVSDLKNPFLNSGSQGVCGVGLDFRSAFIGDAIIDLFSPSGQSVRLVGGTPTSYLTPNVRWDVFFVPQSSMANPDIGFNDIWENDQNWANFVIYRGEYYPHLGRLEDFSLGSANGVWTLRIIDLEDFGDITLLEATIFFCDEEGLSCSECITDAGQILANPISACQNRASISIDLNKTYEVGQDTSLYYYSNIVTKADTVITYIEDIDVLTDLDAGVYRICGIQILEQDTNLLPSVGSFVVADAFEAAILESSSCGIIGDQCVALTVFEIPDTTRINATICKGDIYTVGNEDFEESGQYLVTLQGSQCDSLVFLSLTVLDFNVDIIASSRELSCSESTIQLGVDLASQSLDSVFYIWRDDLGEIIMPSNQPEITISKEGQYVLETVLCTNGYCCTVYDTISVVQSSDFPILTLTADTLTCTRDTVTIGITSSDVIGQVVWTNAAGDVLTPKSDASVDVQIGGVYTVIATHTNG